MRMVCNLRDAEIAIGNLLDRVERLETKIREKTTQDVTNVMQQGSTIESLDVSLNADMNVVTHKLKHNFLMPIDSYIDRGDPSGYDFITGNFTKDWTWRELDLSGIIPKGAKAACIKIVSEVATVNYGQFYLRKHGNSEGIAVPGLIHRIPDLGIVTNLVVALDVDAKVDYIAENVTWTILSLVVIGWWM